GRFVAGVDRLRHELKATVIIVHHTRLDGDRERGNTAFRGAADAMISIKKKKGHQGQFIVANDKQKDAEEFAPLSFMLEPVEAFESCVVVPTIKAGRGAMLIAALRKEGIAPGVPL